MPGKRTASRQPAVPRFNGKFMTCVKAPGGRPYYYASFCDCVPRAERFFAAVCGNHVSVCELRADGHIDFRQVYADEDTEEQFYTCAWTLAPKTTPGNTSSCSIRDSEKHSKGVIGDDVDAETGDGDSKSYANSDSDVGIKSQVQSPASSSSSLSSSAVPSPKPIQTNLCLPESDAGARPDDAVLLIVAGFRGIIKLIDCHTCTLAGTLIGHGNHVNELMVHPKDSNLLFSASRDESLRMWNLKTRTCVVIFAGDKGHRDQVLSVDVHYLASSIVSASMDNTIKIWDLDTVQIRTSIDNSYNPPSEYSVIPFKTTFSQFPSFSTRRVHTNYVDCVRWVGDLLISKSTDNTIVLWRPIMIGPDSYDVLVLREYCMRGADVCWFVRFGLTKQMHQVVCGTCIPVGHISCCCALHSMCAGVIVI